MIKYVFALLTSILLASCNEDDTSLLTGRFSDGPVSGLRYQTNSQAGVTNYNGEFTYKEGEIISFYIGGILIGKTIASKTITPFDLLSITPPRSNVEIVRSLNQMYASNDATPFEIVSNIAVFLHTLDDDEIHSNGIQINSKLHELATNITIDFTKRWPKFSKDLSFNRLLYAAYNSYSLTGGRSVKPMPYALDELYSNLGIVPSISVVKEITNRRNEIQKEVNRFEYYTNGKLKYKESDENNDGKIDSIKSYTWTEDGQISDIVFNSNIEEIEDYTYIATFNEYGIQVLYEHDSESDGTIESTRSYEYDPQTGKILSERSTNTTHGHEDVYNYEYDERGNLIKFQRIDLSRPETYVNEDRYSYDENNNNTFEYNDDFRTIAYHYDSKNQLVMQEDDLFNDNVVDQRITYAYDSEGNRILKAIDKDADGTIDGRKITEYDEYGRKTFELDAQNGFVNAIYRFRYDTNGNNIYYEQDEYGDGSLDIFRNSYYNPDGNLEYTEWYYDGVIKSVYTHEYVEINKWKAITYKFGKTYM